MELRASYRPTECRGAFASHAGRNHVGSFLFQSTLDCPASTLLAHRYLREGASIFARDANGKAIAIIVLRKLWLCSGGASPSAS